MKRLPLWAHITLGIVLGFSVLAIGWTVTAGYIAKKSMEAIAEQLEETNRQAKANRALKEARRKAEIDAKTRARERAKEQARLYALAEQNRKIEQANFKRKQEYNFGQWYEKNMPDECREESNGDLDVECINARIRAEREFKSKY